MINITAVTCNNTNRSIRQFKRIEDSSTDKLLLLRQQTGKDDRKNYLITNFYQNGVSGSKIAPVVPRVYYE